MQTPSSHDYSSITNNLDPKEVLFFLELVTMTSKMLLWLGFNQEFPLVHGVYVWSPTPPNEDYHIHQLLMEMYPFKM